MPRPCPYGRRRRLGPVRVIHDELPAMAMVLAFDHRPHAYLRDLVQTGAVDLLQLPVHDKEVVARLERALVLAHKLAVPEPVLQTVTLAPPPPVDAPVHTPGRIFTVASATGGCGKTFMATNLGYS